MTPPADLPAAGSGAEGDAAIASTRPAPAASPALDGSALERVDAALPGPADHPLASALPPAPRKRPKPGERRVQILQTLAAMLEQPGAERITTAALAAKLAVSEAALYRHFASKAQMFEALVEFIEQSVLALLEPLFGEAPEAAEQVLTALLRFAEHNPGLARVMVGDALVLESDPLALRMNRLFDRIEAELRRSLQRAGTYDAAAATDAEVRASVLTEFAVGRLQRFVRSGFARRPTEHLDTALRVLAA
jgi:TetR/AcrR family transcriptional regulator